MPIKAEREYRRAEEFRAIGEDFIVEGYASTFDPYEMYDDGENKYFERIDPHAFDDCDMSDVIMQYDHSGRVFARNNHTKTLELGVDEHGLHVRANLGSTDASKGLYQDIASGLITQMSFAFIVAEDEYDKKTHTRNVLKIKKLYDVSAVSIPANPGTDISARDYFSGLAEVDKAERLAAEERAKKIAEIKSILED